MDDSQLGDSYAGEVALGGADDQPEDGSKTIDMAVADCDQGTRGLRFTFGDISADLPANNLLSPQLHERRDFLVPAMGWLLVFIIIGLVFAAVLCLVCRKRRSSARLNSEDDWQAQWSQVSGAQTPAGGAVELHQVGVRNPMADDREKGFSDVNLGV